MILTLTARNILENKVRALAIILTISLSTALLFLSLIYSYTVEREFINNLAIDAENADIVIAYSPESDTRIVRATPLNPFLDNMDYAVGVLDLYGIISVSDRIEYVNLRGIKEEGFDKINDINYIYSLDRPLERDEVIINISTSLKLNLTIGDDILIKIGNISKRVYVGKIVKNHPCFETAGAYVFYATEEYASEFIGGYFGGLYNKIYVKSSEGVDRQELIDNISEISEYSNYSVGLIKDTDKLSRQARDISLPVTIGACCCAVLSVILVIRIVNAGFKKRSNIISKLKSIGAGDWYIFRLYFLECLVYIVAGVSIGLLLNYIALRHLIPSLINITYEPYYDIRLYASAIIISIVFIVTLTLPIIKLRSVSVRSAEIKSLNTLWQPRAIIPILGFVLVIASIVLAYGHYLNAVKGGISLSLLILGIMLLLPYVLRYISLFAMYIFKNIKGAAYIALINLKSEKALAGNIRILFIGIIICSIIIGALNISTTLKDQLISDIDCDIIVRNVKGDTAIQINKIKEMEGVYDVYAFQYELVNVNIEDVDYHINLLGINPDELGIVGDVIHITNNDYNDTVLRDTGHMLIDYMYHKVYRIKVGDELAITINNITHNIKVGGFYQSYQYGGRTALINNEKLAELYNISKYDTIVLKTYDDIDDTVYKIRAEMGVYNLIVLNKHEVYRLYFNMVNNAVIFSYYFSFIIFAACIISIIINIINSREDRKVSRYQMSSLGLSRTGMIVSEIIEHSIVGLITLAIAVISANIVNLSITNILSISSIYLSQGINDSVITLISIFFVTIYIIIGIISNISIKKNVINIIKAM